MHFSTDWLTTYLLMPSDKHNSRTAGARDLISSLINIASSRDVPFHQPQLLQCLHQGATFVPLWSPILFLHNPRKVTICGRHGMASVRDIKINEALFVLYLAYHVMIRVCYCRNWDTMAFTYRDMHGACVSWVYSTYFPYFGWMNCRDAFHAALRLYCCVADKT